MGRGTGSAERMPYELRFCGSGGSGGGPAERMAARSDRDPDMAGSRPGPNGGARTVAARRSPIDGWQIPAAMR